MMTTTQTQSRREATVAGSTLTLGVVVSLTAVALAVSLKMFAGASDGVIVVATIVGSSIAGWLQPAARMYSARLAHVR